MRKIAVSLVAILMLSATAIAVAQQATPSPLEFTVNATSTKAKGTKKKPAPIGMSYDSIAKTADGSREESWTTINTALQGVVSNGKLFPTCTLDEIADAQSDAGCAKGALVAEGKLVAKVGPENDFSEPGTPCAKDVHIYNAGQNKTAVILVGPAQDCAGVGYLPPFPGTWAKAGGIGGGQMFSNPIPSNVSHPLPGLLGSSVRLQVDFKKLTKKVKGVKRGYLESIGCKGQRKYTQYVIGDPSGTRYEKSGTTGAC